MAASHHPWLEWIKQVHAVARWGLTYAKDPFDLERYEVLLKLSVTMMADFAQLDTSRIEDLFANEVGYLTPKVDVRGVIFQEGKLLMVQEKWDGRWTIPGGWADIGLSPAEVATKEVQEEAGLIVKPVKMLAMLDKKFYPHPASPYHIYKVFMRCEIVSGEISTGLESQGVGFFSPDQLPELSSHRVTHEQISMLFQHYHDPHRPTDFD
ncbi:NUDIX hydrolase [Vampirovibrio chlorellavorus]|uniref:NUDIX hydrolase n=1 Tax=Vampirovibrio chlorellavorus TaxID=758823 RepID=UPI0026F0D6C8|nr:NUDIX hydrolase [Vampirovibrio chlorellavorus]